MKIRAFQIKNYRSIVDSGKCHLSRDNITAIIGQNESGKTSVLEALRSFYEGHISDDVLRSDLTFPEISCVFEMEEARIDQLINLSFMPPELHDILKAKSEVALSRKWLNARKNIISIAEPEILSYYETVAAATREKDNRIAGSLTEQESYNDLTYSDVEAAEKAVSIARDGLNMLYSRLEEVKRILNKAKRPDIQITAQNDLENLQQQLLEAEKNLKEHLMMADQQKARRVKVLEKLESCRTFIENVERVNSLEKEFLELTRKILETEHLIEICTSEKESRNLYKRLEQYKLSINQLSSELKENKELQAKLRKIADKILHDMNFREAENEAMHETEQERQYYTPEEIGRQIFNHVPLFEFFEDFSSLLPNKIDLEDLLNENSHAEGYKAARNFLSIAGLNADFFREKVHRILKQKIENLNSEITIDFQDYWRQQVGKNDKIRLNFELEHYDYTVPEKSGKPYLEFWIKDKLDRLYPKQRSRGVRWFLSFYLELKATSKQNHSSRVMLIDEPGLSLHARAQEDVLKVFEDLSDNLQIIYCTHSPHLIDLHKLYRILAVQRSNDEDERSETVVLDARSLHEASADTLLPVYSLMGTRLNEKQFIYPKNNIIIDDTVSYYYLEAISGFFKNQDQVHFLPASGVENIPVMANLLFGWKIDFGLLTMDNPESVGVIDLLKKTIFMHREEDSSRKIRFFQGYRAIEDLFSTIDFKRYILHQRIGITVRNSDYISANNLSRIMLATEFCTSLQTDNIQFADFDEETRNNFEKLFTLIHSMHRE
ncbi:MAG TPA: AAA family ATPase [Bacteroidales bacterium]|nr:AAA family ATPase [Bacteroidales bacterium]